MAKCPRCNYYIGNCERTGESGEEHFGDGCPRCGLSYYDDGEEEDE